MKLLIVEDDPRILEGLSVALDGVIPECDRVICRSRDAAFGALRAQTFDFALLDRKIPTADGHLDAHLDHGDAVFAQLRGDSPGTAICFFSAFADEDFLSELISNSEKADIWGSGKTEPLIRAVPKKNMDKLAPILSSVKAETDALDLDIEVNAPFQIDRLDKRVLRIFARRNRARSLLVENLSGGLSGTRILRVTSRDAEGAERNAVAARLGTHSEIRDELRKYQAEVLRLPNGRFASHAGEVMVGAGPRAGVFYLLLANFQSLATLLRSDPIHAARVAERLENVEHRWTADRPHTNVPIAQIRRSLVTDAEMDHLLPELTEFDWKAFEGRHIQARICCQHCDLHCQNVLVENAEPVLIDYTEIADAPACLDALTLELSLLFHPACCPPESPWPALNQVEKWHDIDAFVAGCPVESFVRASRSWAVRAAAGTRELYATAYAVAVRQLKYPDTNKEFAKAIIKSVTTAFANT